MMRLRPRLLLLGVVLLAGAGCGKPEEPISVLLVTPDSLRADRLDPWSSAATARTPALDRLAARGTVFRNAWATAPWTAPSIVSVLTGLYPPAHGVAYRDDTTPTDLPTLPRLLAARGYEIGHFSFFASLSYFRNLGLGPSVPGTTHATVSRRFGEWLAAVPAGHPFFAWVHLLETHLPYGATGYRAPTARIAGSTGLEAAQTQGTVPRGSVEFAAGDREPLLRLYDEDVEAMDRALGELLDALEKTGRTGSTIVVFVADHGEEILDHGWIGHASTAARAELLPEILRVPLLLAGPGLPVGEVRTDLVQPVDLLPTLAERLGFAPPEALDGGSLFEIGRRPLAFFDSSPAGNLTPSDRRDHRIQGVTDGECLLEVRSGPAGGEAVRTRPVGERCAVASAHLRRELDRWRTAQATRRLALLAGAPGDGLPPESAVDAWPETIDITTPGPGEVLRWETSGGRVRLAWEGAPPPVFVAYRSTGGLVPLDGAFRLEGGDFEVGPVPAGFWNDVAGYAPFEVRVVSPEIQARSAWHRVSLAATSGPPADPPSG